MSKDLSELRKEFYKEFGQHSILPAGHQATVFDWFVKNLFENSDEETNDLKDKIEDAIDESREISPGSNWADSLNEKVLVSKIKALIERHTKDFADWILKEEFVKQTDGNKSWWSQKDSDVYFLSEHLADFFINPTIPEFKGKVFSFQKFGEGNYIAIPFPKAAKDFKYISSDNNYVTDNLVMCHFENPEDGRGIEIIGNKKEYEIVGSFPNKITEEQAKTIVEPFSEDFGFKDYDIFSSRGYRLTALESLLTLMHANMFYISNPHGERRPSNMDLYHMAKEPDYIFKEVVKAWENANARTFPQWLILRENLKK